MSIDEYEYEYMSIDVDKQQQNTYKMMPCLQMFILFIR